MNISRRPAAAEDRLFLLELYASTREAELAQVPWSDAQKRMFVEMQFAAQLRGYAQMHPGATHEIILQDAAPVGRLYVSREPQRMNILDITIAPASRNAGVGSAVLKELIEEADRSGKPVSIYVESFNPSLRLFERLGFGRAQQDGFQLLLERPVRAS